MKDLLSINRLSAALRGDRATVEQVARKIIERHRRSQAFRAYTSFDEHGLMRAAVELQQRKSGLTGSRLFGVPVSVKDVFGVRGFPTYAGTPERLGDEWEIDGEMVSALRDAGALFVGKTSTVELAFGGLGQNPHHGTPVNPWDPSSDRVAGGSSAGAGISILAGTALVAIAADTAGSVRVPASMAGIVGYRPTRGRWPSRTGFFPLCQSLDGPGAMTRSVVDLKIVDEVLSKLNARDRRQRTGGSVLRFQFSSDHAQQCAPDIWDCFIRTLNLLTENGLPVEDTGFPAFDAAYEWYGTSGVTAVECAANVAAEIPHIEPKLDVRIRSRLEQARLIPAAEYEAALHAREALIATAAGQLNSESIFLTPTVPVSAPKISEIDDMERYREINRRVTRMTCPVNVLDACAITIPIGQDGNGIPIGLQLMSANRSDELILLAARSIEKIIGPSSLLLGMAPRLLFDGLMPADIRTEPGNWTSDQAPPA